MAMHVLSFLTDLVLDAETAVRFIGVKALKRRSTLIVPGMNVAPSPGSPQFEAQRSPRDDEDDSSETGSPYSGEGEDKSGDAGAESGSPKTGGTADSAARQTEEGQKTTGDHTLAPKRFSDADFEALFDLTLWFVDAATANSLVPIDPELLPARPRHVMHPAQDAPAGQSTSTSILMEASTSLGSAALRRQSPRATRQSSRTVPRSPAAASIAGSTRSNVHGSGRSSAQPGGPNASSAGTKASPTITLSSASTAAQHQYIPGRIQQHNPVGSLVEVFILHESRRRVLQELHEREMRREMDAAARAAKNNQTTPFTVLAGKKNARKKGGLGAGNARNLLRPVSLSPATTLLSTPLIFMATYIRLHGAPWLRNLFSRLFNILRRESVLLYVNRLDLEHPLSPPSQPGTASPQQPQRSPSADSNISPGNSVSARSVAMGAKAVSPTAASPTSTRDTGVRLDSQFYARMERLEDLVSQDILYVLNEFFSALQGKRSTTRLPQGITTLITQFTSTVHLHLLSNVIIGAETIIDSPGAAAEAVYDTLAQLKQKRMAGKAFRAEHVSDTSVSRLIRSIEQYRMAKFILFDCWIIPALNNAVATGFLSESSSMHLRWNIDAFARYLKILVNSPFLDKQPTTNVRARRDEPPPHVSPGGVSPTPRPPPSQAPAAQGRRKRKVKEQTVTAAVPLTLPLPRYITGIYDVSSGSLVHIYQPNESVYDPMEESSPHKMSATAGDIRPYPEQNMTTDIISMRLQSASATRSPSASLRRPSLRTTSSHRVSGSSARGGNAGANTQDSVTRPPPAIYTVMDTAGWEDISSAMKGLNEALGTVGYDPEDLADTYGGGGGLHALGESFTSGVGGPFGEGNCAMRALDLFCRRASTEMAHNVVVPEFEVLPTMAAGCIDKVHEMMTGQHPLVEQALSSGAFPNALSYSPYMSCLYGVLLHPKIAARALDNTFYNSSRFYQHLMRPVQDEGLVHLMSALIVDQDDLPIVDANSLMSLLAANKVPKGVRGAPAELINVHARWEFEARKLRTQRHFLATGALRPADAVSGVQRALETVGPADPFKIVKAGGKLIEKEARVVPMCFDPWWRAMALALCVKAMTVFSECSQAQSESFERWCTEKTDGAQRDNRQARDRFIKSKGREDGEVDGAVERDERGVRRNSGLYAKAASRDRSNSAAGNLPSLRSSSKRRKKKKKGPGGKKKAAVTRR